MRLSTNEYKLIKKRSKSKFKNKKAEYNGRVYDSKREAQYAKELDLLRRAVHKENKVIEWTPQVRYPLAVNNQKICTYVLDFMVKYADGRVEYVDVKGVRTDVYKIKKKLMKAIYDIDITEVK